jgi:ferredoxin
MAYVVTRLCRDCLSTECVDACPVVPSCFYRPANPGPDLPNQLYISPNECTNCTDCEPACPWEAIFPDESLPAGAEDDMALNQRCDDEREKFVPATYEKKPDPDPASVKANHKKWGIG